MSVLQSPVAVSAQSMTPEQQATFASAVLSRQAVWADTFSVSPGPTVSRITFSETFELGETKLLQPQVAVMVPTENLMRFRDMLNQIFPPIETAN